MASGYPPPPPGLAWAEIGRAVPGGGAQWAAWIALLGGEDALYRTLVVADGSASIVVEVRAQHPPVTRTLHRGGCRLPWGIGDRETIRRLLDAADEAACAALVSPAGRSGGPRPARATQAEAASGGRPAPPRPTPAADDRRSAPSPSGPWPVRRRVADASGPGRHADTRRPGG